MRGNIVLSKRESEEELRYNFLLDEEDNDYSVSISMDPLDTYSAEACIYIVYKPSP